MDGETSSTSTPLLWWWVFPGGSSIAYCRPRDVHTVDVTFDLFIETLSAESRGLAPLKPDAYVLFKMPLLGEGAHSLRGAGCFSPLSFKGLKVNQWISARNTENEDANICKRNLTQSFLQLQGFQGLWVNFSAAVLNYSLVPIV